MNIETVIEELENLEDNLLIKFDLYSATVVEAAIQYLWQYQDLME